jgi:hypothetical protein
MDEKSLIRVEYEREVSCVSGEFGPDEARDLQKIS